MGARKGSILLTFAVVSFLVWGGQASAQGVKTLSTGVGEEERVPASGYSVRFEFAELGGAYLAQVAVVIKDGSRKTVVELVSKGPWLWANLDPGLYRITATAANGRKQGAEFTVEAGRTEVVRLVWR